MGGLPWRRWSRLTTGANWQLRAWATHWDGRCSCCTARLERSTVLCRAVSFSTRLGVRLISYTRPGYPGSSRDEGRTVADAAADVEAIADKLGLGRFSVIGRSGGAPHALACAAAKPLRDRVICTAALSSLAPYDVHGNGLDWFAGMADSNIEAYRNVTSFHKMADTASGLQSLIATFNEHARQVRNNSQGLLNTLWPELVESDRRIIGDVALRFLLSRGSMLRRCAT